VSFNMNAIVGPDPPVGVEDHELEADSSHLAARRHHLPTELDDVAEAGGVALRPERELSTRDELLECAGYSGLQLTVAASLEGCRDVQRRGGLLNLPARLEYVEGVLGP
jgi:hypothetical protein